MNQENEGVVLTGKGKSLVEFCKEHPLPEGQCYGLDDDGDLVGIN